MRCFKPGTMGFAGSVLKGPQFSPHKPDLSPDQVPLDTDPASPTQRIALLPAQRLCRENDRFKQRARKAQRILRRSQQRSDAL
jgi:hypothetical protein